MYSKTPEHEGNRIKTKQKTPTTQKYLNKTQNFKDFTENFCQC